MARAAVQKVRTTAYTHSEADHIQHGRSTALGTRLSNGTVKSAAADWSRWPAGTTFRIRETGEIFRVDDYGWALAGTNTIDLYKPSRSAMNRWGVRHVTIEHLSWGDVDRSRQVLRPRSKHRHVKRMLDQIDDRYSEISRPLELPGEMVAGDASEDAPSIASAAPAAPIPTATVVHAHPAAAVARTVPRGPGGATLTPFRAVR